MNPCHYAWCDAVQGRKPTSYVNAITEYVLRYIYVK